MGSAFVFRLFFKTKKTISPTRIAIPPSAAAMPTPIFAPVERPLLLCFGCGERLCVTEVGDVGGGLDDVVEGVEDVELVVVLLTGPRTAAIDIAWFVPQQLVFWLPQHQDVDVFFPSQGVTCAFSPPSFHFWTQSAQLFNITAPVQVKPRAR